jgi:hypothetical protein
VKRVGRRVPGLRAAVRTFVPAPSPAEPRRRAPDPKLVSPVTREDLHPLPSGWVAGGPAFVGVGAPKCGTSWWYTLIEDHPAVVPNRVRGRQHKELFYFVHYMTRELPADQAELYREMFAAPPGAIAGEFTTTYLAHPCALEHLAATAPDTRVIAILRNPIDRWLSHLNHFDRNRAAMLEALDPERAQILRTFSFLSEGALHSLYGVGLARLNELFPPERVLVLQYERCVAAPEAELARTYRFLGLDERHVPDRIRQSVNAAPSRGSGVDPAVRRRIASYFRDDVRRTFEMVSDLDRSLWPDFAEDETGAGRSSGGDSALRVEDPA